MILFIIPLKSKTVSRDWLQVSKLIENTLRSVCNQTSESFKVVVVCHEKPEVKFEHPKLEYLKVNFPAPKLNQSQKDQGDSVPALLDQSRKYWAGLQYAKQINPTHVMFVDADDYISKHIVRFVEENPERPGWCICTGYEYQFGSKKVFLRRKNFNLRSGTSHIIRFDLLKESLIDFRLVTDQYLRHQKLCPMLEKKGILLDCLPFAGSIYVTENEENMRAQLKYYLHRNGSFQSKFLFLARRLYKKTFSKSITPQLQNEFFLKE